MAVDNAGFNSDPLVGDVDCKDTVHSREADDDATRERECAARESGAGAPGNKRNAMLGTDADDCLNFLPGSRQDNRGRYGTKSGEPIALVCLELISLHDDSIVADHRTKVC
jgi:hypothetical protein